MPLPSLRYLDISPIEHEGQTLVCLRDTEGFVDEPLVVSPVAYFIASYLDGENNATDIQYAFSKATGGSLLRTEDIERVVEFLDQHGFLLTERYASLRAGIEQTFAADPVRPAYLAGKSYPEDPDALRLYLDALFTRDDGPGEALGNGSANGESVRCLIVPHIDYDRGGHSYAHGYLRLSKAAPPETIFVFGVAHAGPPVPFVLSRKHFDTPFGTIPTDLEVVDALATACSWDPFEYEIVHRTEHSVELQAVMIARLFGTTVKMVPILCSLFPPEIGGSDTAADASITAFLDKCRELVSARPGRIAVIAGADLAHVGKRFGDEFDIDDSVIGQVEARDEEDLAHAIAMDPAEWYRSVMKDANQRRVCGLACIYSALKSVEGLTGPGRLLHYGYAPDPAGGIVSFANVVYS